MLGRMRVAIYTRLSSDPNGQQTATERQARACEQFAAAREWDVVRVIEDVDVSAYNKTGNVNRDWPQRARFVWPHLKAAAVLRRDALGEMSRAEGAGVCVLRRSSCVGGRRG
jgi:hypothetical protein